MSSKRVPQAAAIQQARLDWDGSDQEARDDRLTGFLVVCYPSQATQNN